MHHESAEKALMSSGKASFKDGILILSLGALVFFGALFLFASIQEESEVTGISLEETERLLDKKINSRISAIEAKVKFKKRRPVVSEGSYDSVEQSSLVSDDLDLFKATDIKKEAPENILEETIQMVNKDNESEEEKRAYIESYKKEYIQRARKDGWVVKLNDNLEVVSATRIKPKN